MVLGLLIVGACFGLGAQPLPEATVKAAFIGHFPEFVDWPAQNLASQAPIVICLSASQPFGEAVKEMVGSKTVKGHSIAIRHLTRKSDRPDGCHVLYVAANDQELLQRTQGLPILTVGDQPGFCQLGGVINFRVVGGRVRFEVNLTQAKRVGLRLDSQFLRLASALFGGQP